jgi:hypothetical protein
MPGAEDGVKLDIPEKDKILKFEIESSAENELFNRNSPEGQTNGFMDTAAFNSPAFSASSKKSSNCNLTESSQYAQNSDYESSHMASDSLKISSPNGWKVQMTQIPQSKSKHGNTQPDQLMNPETRAPPAEPAEDLETIFKKLKDKINMNKHLRRESQTDLQSLSSYNLEMDSS